MTKRAGETMPDKLTVIQSQQMNAHGEPDVGTFNCQFLAQGDSWFTTNTVEHWSSSNLLKNLEFAQAAVAVNCADPGDTLTHMVDLRRDPLFYSLLAGPKEQPWSAILLSGGGNDLIDAVQVAAIGDNGVPVAPHERLLLTSDEWGGPLAAADNRYISAQGWETFRLHLEQQFKALDFMRSKSKHNTNTPIFTHTYDYATPRASGAGLGIGPWLLPALTDYKIPANDWNAIADAFIDKLASISMSLTLQNFHVIDTRGILTRADAQASGISNDWENEIHATEAGYGKLAVPFVSRVSTVLGLAAPASPLGVIETAPAPVVTPAVAAKRRGRGTGVRPA
ncbi:hypothetical protein [Caballeronia sp. GAWG2-1]|uniref:hypothetical protein n=1 Tax=Caballeronia sp. GAWG2-1 TaxID=2921744 RepID=UPI002028AC6A|nr:hypothetical protein [Caballeronia sp. GAWG2-1]